MTADDWRDYSEADANSISLKKLKLQTYIFHFFLENAGSLNAVYPILNSPWQQTCLED
jgi:hypothetical protein